MARGGGLNLFGAVCSQAAQLSVTLLVGRALGQASLGRYAQAFAFLSLLGLLSLSGFRSGLTRFVAVHLAERKVGALRGTIRLGISVSTIGASILGAGLWAVAPTLASHVFHDPALVMPLRFVAVTLPAASYTDAALAATQGFRTQKPFALIGLIFQPLTQAALAAGMVAAGLGLRGAMIALLVTEASAAVLAAGALRRLIGRPRARPVYDVRRLFGFSMVTWVASLATTGLVWADTILLGALRTAREVGQYNVATRLVMLAVFVAPPITASFGPYIADLYHRDRTEALRRVYGVATSWIVRLSLPAFVLLLAYPRQLLDVFGHGFAVGATVTVILAGGKLIDAATGPCGLMLNMSGRPKLSMIDNVSVLIVNVGLNLVLIPRYGIVGSAVAWAVSLVLVNIARVLQVWISMRMLPFDLGVLKGLSAGSAALAVAFALTRFLPLPEPLDLVVGVPLVVGCYVGLLLLQGITDEDRQILKPLLRKVGLGKLVKMKGAAPPLGAAAPAGALAGPAATAAAPATAVAAAEAPAAAGPAPASAAAAAPVTPPPLPDTTGSWSLFAEMPLVDLPVAPVARRGAGAARAGRRRPLPAPRRSRPNSSYTLWQRAPRPRPAFSPARQLRTLRRRSWLVVSGLLLGAAAGVALPAVLPAKPGFAATIRLELQPFTTEVASPTGPPKLTAAQLAANALTGGNATRTLQRLGPDAAQLSVTRTLASPQSWPAALLAHLHARTASLADRTVDLTYTDTDRRLAAEVVQTYADAFVATRNRVDKARTAAALHADAQQLAALQEQVVALRQDPGVLGGDPASAAKARSVEQQYQTLQDRANQLRRLSLLGEAPTAAPLPPSVARGSVQLSPPVLLAAAALLGLLLGAAAALLAETAAPLLASAADVEAAVGSDVAAWVPRPRRSGPGKLVRRAPRRPVLAGEVEPLGPEAEAYRRLAVALERRGLGHDLLALAVLSPTGGEGRTTVSVNLARELARAGHGVVLVSGDLDDPGVERAFELGTGEAPGVSDHLAGTHPDALTLLVAARENLMVLPLGVPRRNPAELLAGNSQQPAELVSQLRQLGLIVVIDTAPGNWSPDGIALAAVADAALLVAQSGRSRWRVMAAFAAALRNGHFPIAGAVLLGARSARRAAGMGMAGAVAAKPRPVVRLPDAMPAAPAAPPVSSNGHPRRPGPETAAPVNPRQPRPATRAEEEPQAAQSTATPGVRPDRELRPHA